jgi:hypothetical protein
MSYPIMYINVPYNYGHLPYNSPSRMILLSCRTREHTRENRHLCLARGVHIKLVMKGRGNMTLSELKVAIENKVGLESILENVTKSGAEFRFLSPTGVSLFVVNVYCNSSNWHFGGHGSLLNGLWNELCGL